LTAKENLLIVEDDTEWCDAYARAATREGVRVVRVAKDLTGAKSLINDMQFAVAFVDIGLNIGDDQNVDGLRVMEAIRATGDKTSIVVVTGRSGRDVLPITRDAIKKYDAHEIIGKADIEPQDIRKLLVSGLDAFEKRSSAVHPHVNEVLNGALQPLEWDDQVLRIAQAKDGAQGLHGFLDRLLPEFFPLVADRDSAASRIEPEAGLVHGRYWSRSVADAVAVCFGDQKRAIPEIELAISSGSLLNRYAVGEVLKRSTGNRLSGAVFALNGTQRADYAGV
jgi:ActR/RegA family two-component response regulator